MKLKFFLIINLFFSIFCFAEIRDSLSFSVLPHVSISIGSHDEKFYSGFAKKKEVSYLQWKIEPLITLGFDTSFQFHNFKIDSGFDYGLPVKAGSMYDSDFDSFSDLQYCYSISELYAEQNIYTYLDFSYIVHLSNKLSLEPHAAIQYYYDSFEARNGYGWYGMETQTHPLISWDDPRATFYESGKLNGVDFSRHSLLIFTGMAFNYNIKTFSSSIGFQSSPYSYFYTLDHHLSKSGGYTFKQIQESSFKQFLLSINCSLQINKYVIPSISLSHHIGNISRGLLYNDIETKEMLLSTQKSGASLNLTTIKIGMIFNII